MDRIGPLATEQLDQIIIENKMMKAGFAAVPYVVLEDTRLKPGPIVTYATLLRYAWQEGSTFAGQETLAKGVGVGVRQLREYLTKLQDLGYIVIKRQGLNKPNIYYIKDVMTKLAKGKSKRSGTTVPVKTGAPIPL